MIATVAAAAGAPGARWPRHGAALAGVALLILLLFARDVGDLATIWWTNTTFGHCLFIPPVVGWLVWLRRETLRALTPAGWAPGLAAVALGALAWLVGDAAGVGLARHIGLLVTLQGATLALLGPQVGRVLLFPLLYAAFAIPFGEGAEPLLQQLTVVQVMPLLHLAGMPARVEGVLITIPAGRFEIAEACSGSKFLIAMLAYGVLVAHLGFRGWRRRIAFLAIALVVPVLANGLRAFGTIYAAQWIGVEAATGADHIVFGWIFFGLVMAAVLALGWRWFDRDPDAAWDGTLPAAPRRPLDLPLACCLTLAVAAAAPAWSAVALGRADPLPARLALPELRGWRRTPIEGGAAWSPYHPAAEHFLIGRYRDGRGAAVDLAVAVYARQSEGHELIGFGIGPLRQNDRWVRVSDEAALNDGAVIRVTGPEGAERLIASWYRVGDTLSGDPARVKLATLLTRLGSGRQRAIALHLSATEPGGRVAMARFLAALGPLDAFADRVADAR